MSKKIKRPIRLIRKHNKRYFIFKNKRVYIKSDDSRTLKHILKTYYYQGKRKTLTPKKEKEVKHDINKKLGNVQGYISNDNARADVLLNNIEQKNLNELLNKSILERKKFNNLNESVIGDRSLLNYSDKKLNETINELSKLGLNKKDIAQAVDQIKKEEAEKEIQTIPEEYEDEYEEQKSNVNPVSNISKQTIHDLNKMFKWTKSDTTRFNPPSEETKELNFENKKRENLIINIKDENKTKKLASILSRKKEIQEVLAGKKEKGRPTLESKKQKEALKLELEN